MKLQELKLRTIRLPLIRPYVLSYRTFTEFGPIIVEVRDSTAVSAGARGISLLAPAARRGKAAGHSAPQPSSTKTRRRPSPLPANGFFKPKARLFAEPLRFAAGELVLAAGYTPTIDADVLATHELARERYSSREKH